MTYDNEGRFRPQAFEDIFAKYDKGNKGGLTWRDLIEFWKGQRLIFDLFGISAVILECVTLFFSFLVFPFYNGIGRLGGFEWKANEIDFCRGSGLSPALAG